MSTKVIFFGSPEFALPSLRSLADTYNVVGVVTQPDRPAGRGRSLKSPPVKLLAQECAIPIIQPDNIHHSTSMAQLSAWGADIIVVAAFGQILKDEVLNLTKYGCINVHASLLPRWRGAAPINAAILHGDKETGITIMQMDKGLDTGPIISQRSILISSSDNAGTLSEKLAELGGELLVDALPGIISGEIPPLAQDDSFASYAPMLKKEDGLLDFFQPVIHLERKVRAYSPWPGTFMIYGGKTLKVHKAHMSGGDSGKPGQTTRQGNFPGVFCVDNILILDEVQPAGKKRMSGQVFLNGARDWGTQ